MNPKSKIKKILLWSAVLILAVVLFLCTGENPSPNAEIALRKLEKKNLIGPAQIIDCMDFPHGAYEHILIGRSEYGYTIFEYNENNWDKGNLTYIARREGATLYCTYNQYGSEKWSRDWLPIFAMVEDKAAATAKLTLTTIHSGKTVHYPLEAIRSGDGYFLFSWETLEVRAFDFWLVQQLIANQYTGYVIDGTAQATLEVFDAKGTLLDTYIFTK